MMNQKLITTTLIASAALLLGACAPQSSKIQPSYVSPLQYQDYSCKQIRAEIGRVGRRMSEVNGAQDKTASDDSAAMAVGMILFWPALFFIDSSDQRVEVARMKGEFDALEQAAIQKNCAIAKEIEEVRARETERLQKQKAGQPANKVVSRQ